MSILLLLTACTPAYECDRAYGSPVDRGYVGEPGADRCDAAEVCASAPGDAGGSCITDGECVLDGLGGGEGVSKDCAATEVCVIADGDWYGTCAPAPATGDISGEVTCDAPVGSPLTVATGEVVAFDITFSPPQDTLAGVNVESWLADVTGPITYGGNPLGVSAAVYEDAIDGSFVHSFQEGGDLTWNVDAFQCNPTAFSGTWERWTPGVHNVDTTRAMPLAAGESVSATLGCYDQNGAGEDIHVAHVYALDAAAGDVLHLDLSVASLTSTTGDFSWTYATLQDASGAAVIESGNPVSLDTSLEASATRDYTVEADGSYFLVVDTDFSRCDITEYTLSY